MFMFTDFSFFDVLPVCSQGVLDVFRFISHYTLTLHHVIPSFRLLFNYVISFYIFSLKRTTRSPTHTHIQTHTERKKVVLTKPEIKEEVNTGKSPNNPLLL